ncbi:MAG: pantetheine-phosphate adenylyltransferase [Ignavibacteriae bacterium]|nr:pantetheine-phosphate adenylyltransferase [Ignavibacteriota bacterium]
MKKNTAVYPGTFDPVTNGHLDIIERASGIFDKVIVTIALNSSKVPLFTKEERKSMIKEVINKYKNVEVDSFDGLLVNYAAKKKANTIIRGLRVLSDFEYEFQMSLTNRKLAPDINTIFLMPNEKYAYLNSSLVKELAKFKGQIKSFVPEPVRKKLEEKFR